MIKRINSVKENPMELFMIVVVIFEVIAIMFINLRMPSNLLIDKDYAKLAKHVVEMGKNHKIFLQNWNYLTTGEFDCAALLATPIYMLTGNVYKSFAVSNIINTLFLIALIWRIFSKCDVKKQYRLLAIAAILCVYDYGMLAHTNMMFYCGGQYIYKATIAIILLSVLVTPVEKRGEWVNIAEIIVFSFLYLVSCISSGSYLFICAIAPLIFCQIVYFLNEKTVDKYRILILADTFVLTVFGNFLCKIFEINPNSSSMVIRYSDAPLEEVRAVCQDILFLVNPFFAENLTPVSLGGVSACMKWIVIIFIIIGLSGMKKVFGADIFRYNSEHVNEKFVLESSLISIFVWNFFILFMTSSSPRYHLIGIVPLMMLSAVKVGEILDKYKPEMEKIIISGLGICFVTISFYNITDGRDAYYKNFSDYYIVDADHCGELINFLDVFEANNMYIVDYSELPELMRLVDDRHSYELYISSIRGVENYDYYYADMDKSTFSDRNLILCRTNDLDRLPEYILSSYEAVGLVQDCTILFSEHNPNDGLAGSLEGCKTVDLPTTPSYYYIGSINEDGYLNTNIKDIQGEETTILASPGMEIEAGKMVTFNYNVDNDGVFINEYKDNVLVQKYPLGVTEESLTIAIEGDGVYRFDVINSGWANSTVREIVFE
ncbi:hypothetical protein SAMN04487831_11264 [Pseudobutyrivibrio sp. UC1225]|uniref:hypothetical protein n=1 Tax=Pseudobutyrivibrio sp. UC1225 TaxID=1798185 RepID=UPI0008EBD1B0|nr:hypothetical protein [Pseudobutyrivibrio sp. UC1225]SFO21897.1 hypothetical protein SAMN04487831_11264 [Pseudobutyrivibrio sp. UC1225]